MSGQAGPAVGTRPEKIAEIEAKLQRGERKAARKDRLLAILTPVFLVFGVFMTWEFSVRLFEMPAYLLPTPTAIVEEFGDRPSLFLSHSLQTLKEITFGYALAVMAGIPLAIAISEWKVVERLVYPVLVSSHAIPKSALAPLFIVWFGFGIAPKIMITFLISFFPIVIAAVVGFRSVEQEKLYLARAIGLTKKGTFYKIQLPHALPSIFGGLRVGITLAVIGAVVAEFVGADAGLGYLLIIANSTVDTTRLFASLFLLMFMSTSLFLLVGLAERLTIPWHVSQRKKRSGLQPTP